MGRHPAGDWHDASLAIPATHKAQSAVMQSFTVSDFADLAQVFCAWCEDAVPVEVVHRGRYKTMLCQHRRWLKDREATRCRLCCVPRGSTSAGCCGPSFAWACRRFVGCFAALQSWLAALPSMRNSALPRHAELRVVGDR